MGERMTAMDIEGQEFDRKVRGYDPDAVRLYLRSVAEEIERLNLENASLREDVGNLKDKAEEYRDRERSLQETLVAAQQMAEEYREKTRLESDLMIKEARLKSERLLEHAQDQLSRIESEISRAKLERDAFENRLRAAIEEHQALLDLRKKERAEVENLRFLRRRSGTEAG
ncbi:MAG: DivIVA domain-containing protein [Acidobacteriota bacterium]|nr:DivIVA domain-containing protein [Acidobacteriota bacterium]